MRTILVVDDSPTIRKMVRAALGSLTDVGFIEAALGLQAIETLAIHPVRMVVLDLNMPDMHGLDVLRFLRSHTPYRDLPAMVRTTRSDDTSREEVLEAGHRPISPSHSPRASLSHPFDSCSIHLLNSRPHERSRSAIRIVVHGRLLCRGG